MSWLVGILLLTGAFFAFVAALGLVRLPDFFCRMHAAAKAGAFGGLWLALAAGVHLGTFWGWLDVLLIIFLFYLTTPIASHLLGRAAYLRGVPLWSKTLRDEWQPAQRQAANAPEHPSESAKLKAEEAGAPHEQNPA